MTAVLRRAADERPEQAALTDLVTSLTWPELLDRVERSVAALDGLNLAPGARVAVVMRNSVDAALVYLMARYAGVELTALSYHLTQNELDYVFRDARVAAVFCDPTTIAVVDVAATALGIAHVFVGDTSAAVDASSNRPSFGSWVASHQRQSVDVSRPAAANLLYTSGTTGFPKGVLTPANLSMSIGEYIDAYPEKSDDGPYLTVGPLYHAGPLGSIRRVTAGRPLVVLRHFDPIEALTAIEKFRITGATFVPTHFIRMLQLDEETRARFDTSSLHFVDHTGSWCPPEVKRGMIDWLGPILEERYGGTESGTICTIGSTEWLAHPGSVGRCSSRFTAHVVDDDGKEVPVGQTGRLFFIDHTGKGVVYQNDPEKTAAAHLRPGVFTLGDIGHVDPDGYVYITGRSADLIVSGGVNLYPAEIERVLLLAPDVADAAVVGAPDEVMGERAVAFVVLASSAAKADRGDDETKDRIIDSCRKLIAGPKVPREIRIIAELPRNPMGKLDRRALKSMLKD